MSMPPTGPAAATGSNEKQKDRQWSFRATVGAAFIAAVALIFVTGAQVFATQAQEQQNFQETKRQAAYQTYVNVLGDFEVEYELGRQAIATADRTNSDIQRRLDQLLVRIRSAKSAVDLIGSPNAHDAAVTSIGAYGSAKGSMVATLKKLAKEGADPEGLRQTLDASKATLDNLVNSSKERFIDAARADLGVSAGR